MREIIAKVKEKTNIPVYERTIENVVSAVLASSDIWRIVDLSEEPLPLVVAVLEVLNESGYVEFRDGVFLTEKWKKFAEQYVANYCTTFSSRTKW